MRIPVSARSSCPGKGRLLGQLSAVALVAGLGAGCSSNVFDVGDPAFTGSTANQQSIISAQAGAYSPAAPSAYAPAAPYGTAQSSGIRREALPPPPGAAPAYPVANAYPAGPAAYAAPVGGAPGTYTPPRPYAARGLPTPMGPVGTVQPTGTRPAPNASAPAEMAENTDLAPPLPVQRGTPPRTLGDQAQQVQGTLRPVGVQMASVDPRGTVPVQPRVTPAPLTPQPQAAIIEPTPSVASAPALGEVATQSAAADEFRWPVRGRIISSFGKKPSGERNDGIDLAVPEGTSVKAAEDGEVIYAGNELKSYGNLVLIRHANGWVSAYAHNSALKVKRGDKIQRGQIVAVSGMTGGVTTPQVHFELRKDATPVDPVGHLSDG